jgi:hypothetical protein
MHKRICLLFNKDITRLEHLLRFEKQLTWGRPAIFVECTGAI